MPADPPASGALGSPVTPISVRTDSTPTPSASAAIWVSTVRAPVPMSVALSRTTYSPSGWAVTVARLGERSTG